MATISTTHERNALSGRVRRHGSIAGVWTAREVVILLLAISWPNTSVLASDNLGATGVMHGTVYTATSGVQSPVAEASVRLSGPVGFETTTDAEGKFAFAAIPLGSYTIEATFSGLEAVQAVTVGAGGAVHLVLQLKPTEVKTSVIVTASTSDPQLPSPTTTINEKTLRDAPNMQEKFDSLLPLVPGVVRGPDGHINLKGASSTQNGALVNSANVTDPATGSPAINLPIDVVSSVHVISNPYDPQYGRFTGAVSSVETKTGSYEGYHFSIQNILPRWRDRDGHIVGLGAATPRMTFTGPMMKDRVAFTQSFEYRFVRTPVNSLPPLQRDTRIRGLRFLYTIRSEPGPQTNSDGIACAYIPKSCSTWV